MTPTQVRYFRVNRAGQEESRWLKNTLDREEDQLGAGVVLTEDNTLRLRWKNG